MKLQHYLFASELNDYKPWIITPQALAVFCLVIWGLRFFVPATITIAAPGIDPTDLMNRINNERTSRFIPALNTNNDLIIAATGKAQDMLARSYFAHVDPDGNYVWPRIEAAGYTPYLMLGENLAMDFTTAEDVVDAWMNSPTHRENIVNPGFEDQGLSSIFGTYEPNHDTNMVVSLFGTLYITKAPPVANPTPPVVYPTPPVVPTPKIANPIPPVVYPTPPPTNIAIPPTPVSTVSISKDIKISTTSLSGHTLVNLDVMIAGSPTLATANLKTQSITLIPGKVQGEFVGSFTFDPTEDLSNQTVTVEARDEAGTKTSQDFPVNFPSPTVSASNQTPTVQIPVSNDAEIINILRIVFGIFAVIYMAFLAIDAVIVHRAKVKRTGINSWPHLLVFFLIAVVTLFSNWH